MHTRKRKAGVDRCSTGAGSGLEPEHSSELHNVDPVLLSVKVETDWPGWESSRSWAKNSVVLDSECGLFRLKMEVWGGLKAKGIVDSKLDSSDRNGITFIYNLTNASKTFWLRVRPKMSFYVHPHFINVEWSVDDLHGPSQATDWGRDTLFCELIKSNRVRFDWIDRKDLEAIFVDALVAAHITDAHMPKHVCAHKHGSAPVKAEVDGDEKEKEEDKLTCKICYERPVDCTMQPCGHAACVKCVGALKDCPFCRKAVDSRSSLFLP